MFDKLSARRPAGKAMNLAGSLLLSTALLTACSVPDSANPAKWFSPASDAKQAEAGDAAYPKLSSVPEAPKTLSPEDRDDLKEGLVADRNRAKHSGESIKREGNPTRPLSPAAAPPAAAAPAPVPAPAPKAEAPKAPAPVVQQAAPAPAAVAAVPAQAPTPVQPRGLDTPPPPAAIVNEVPPPVPAGLAQSALAESYQRRLAESAAQSPVPVPPTALPSARPPAAPAYQPAPQLQPPAAMAQAPRLTPPWERNQPASAVRSLSEFDPATASGSVQLGTVIFAEGSSKLTADGSALLREVARAHKEQGGSVRIVGHGTGAVGANAQVGAMMQNFELAMQRANVVAASLRKLGVPAGQLFVGAVTDTDALSISRGARTEIYLDY